MLRVLTLNIWNLSGPWRQRREEIAAWLARVAPDVVCLQEVMQAPDGRDQAQWLAGAPPVAALGYTAVFAPGMDLGEHGWFGNAVLTRGAVEASHTLALPAGNRPPEARVLLHVRTGGVDVFCTHLNWEFHHGDVREEQVLAVADAVDGLAAADSPLPPVIAGDFNAEDASTEMRFLTGLTTLAGRTAYFQDAWRVAGGRGPGFTWDNRNPFAAAEFEPDRRIDYILCGWRRPGGAGRVEAARVVCDRALTGTFASDHFGVVADIAT